MASLPTSVKPSKFETALALLEKQDYAHALDFAKRIIANSGSDRLRAVRLAIECAHRIGNTDDMQEWLKKNTPYDAKTVDILFENMAQVNDFYMWRGKSEDGD